VKALISGGDMVLGTHRVRSWTNQWAARGVVVRRGDERDLPLLCELMQHTAAAQGRTPLPAAYVTTLYRELAPGNAALFVGELDRVPLAADLVTRCGGLVRGRLGGFDRSGEATRVSLPAAVRWQILQWAKDQGAHWLDFGGLSQRTLDILLSGGCRPEGGWDRRRPAEADLRRHRIPVPARCRNDPLAPGPRGLPPRSKLAPRSAGARCHRAAAAQRAVLAAKPAIRGPAKRIVADDPRGSNRRIDQTSLA
jgi:Acetyltransferase (GNAT) domain